MNSRIPLLQTDNRDARTGNYLLGYSCSTVAEFRQSRFTDASLHSEEYVDSWIANRLSEPRLEAQTVPLNALDHWFVDPETGNIRHDSGRFFSITGIMARHRTISGELEWDQPMIDQPEVGILGLLAKRINGVLHFCIQAKEEPGNINSVQLSPTVQATYSNYTCAHGGTPPPLLDFFLAPGYDRLLFAKLQTEDGGRFLFKSNRNMIVRIDDHELDDLPPGFIWVTLRQIAALLKRDNLIHATTRSILSSLLIPGLHDSGSSPDIPPEQLAFPCEQISRTVQWLDDMKAANHIMVKREPLNILKDWEMDGDGFFSRRDRRFFRVLGLDVHATGREVGSWQQPILENPEKGVIGLLMRVHNGKRFYLMQAKAEAGNRTTVQLAPTVQFTPTNYLGNHKLPKPFLFDEFSGNGKFPVHTESLQSEEGARFFREKHRHRVLLLPENAGMEIPPDFRWLSESEIQFFLHMGETVNSCARSILACLM